MKEKLSHQWPFRELEAHELDFLLAAAALSADEARVFSGTLMATQVIAFDKFKDWFVSFVRSRVARAFCCLCGACVTDTWCLRGSSKVDSCGEQVLVL